MKKLFTVLLASLLLCTLVLGFASCGKVRDMSKIEKNGYFTCGITVYDPMNYFNDDGDLVGFDTEFAEAVAAKLGLEAKFQVIRWSNKYLELNGGSIDCIWNGFTYGNESDGTSRADYVDFSYAYLNNSQCVVMKASDVASHSGIASLAGLHGMAEGGSAGESVAKDAVGETGTFTAADSQASALMELKAGTVDFAVVDILLAQSQVGKGDYADLAQNTSVVIEGEVYAIGFRRGSDFTEKVNQAMVELANDGTLATIAAKYGLSNALIQNIGQ